MVLLFTNSVFALKSLSLDVSDQNFSSTNKIVIDQDEIKKSRSSNLPALLATKANISISTNNLQPNSIYIRGGDSSHVLILVDGVPTYDSSSPQRTLNLFNLNLSKIKRIEILKGSQSVIYGGQAMSGVIKIETFSAFDEKTKKTATSVIVDTSLSRAWANKQTLSVDTVVNTNENISVAGSIYGLNARNNSPVKDSPAIYPQKTVASDLAVQIRGDIENIFKVSYSKDENNIANTNYSNYKPYDTLDFSSSAESVGISWILKKSDFLNLTTSALKINRSFDQSAANNLAPPPDDGLVDRKFEGLLTNIRLDIDLLKNKFIHLISGTQLNSEKLEIKYSGITDAKNDVQFEGLYLKADHQLPLNLFLEYGIRQETIRFKPLATTYHVGILWNDFLKLEYSTGFKSPSLFQLYAVGYGNPDLQAEKAKNFSLTLEHKFSDYLFSSLTYFDSQFENFIITAGSPSKYSNVSAARTVGLESLTNLNLLDGGLRFTLSLGYQEPRDLSKASNVSPWLLRRPLRSASFRISSDIDSQLNVGSEINHTGEKLDVIGSSKYSMVDDYTLINIFMNFNLSDSQAVFARIENIENKDYQTTYGFYNQGAVYKTGLQFNF